MRLKQREMNREALMMAVAMVRDADFDALFGAMADEGETDAEIEHNQDVMAKAQRAAVSRIERLVGA